MRPIFNGQASVLIAELVGKNIEEIPGANGPIKMLRLALKAVIGNGKNNAKFVVARFSGDLVTSYRGNIGDHVVLTGGMFDVGQETNKLVMTMQRPSLVMTTSQKLVHKCEVSGVWRASEDKEKKDKTGIVAAIRTNTVKTDKGETDVLNVKAYTSGYDKAESKTVSISAEIAGWGQGKLGTLVDKHGQKVLQPKDNFFLAHGIPTVEFDEAGGYVNFRLTGQIGLLYNARGSSSNGAAAEAQASAGSDDPFASATAGATSGGASEYNDAPPPF